ARRPGRSWRRPRRRLKREPKKEGGRREKPPSSHLLEPRRPRPAIRRIEIRGKKTTAGGERQPAIRPARRRRSQGPPPLRPSAVEAQAALAVAADVAARERTRRLPQLAARGGLDRALGLPGE